jgi:chromosome segregation protein
MRLTRLVLERYGHVSGESLNFPAEVGLHVVLGANEAGKSTALEAVADGLFGFPARQHGRLNHPDDPRIGFTVRGADGIEASFMRRKTGREKLLDGSGAPVPETALARFLGGTGRERFQDVFGLDAERLRRAGRTIMAEQGEAGAAILQAQTGLRGLRETVQHLDDEAKLLFGDGRGQRRISAAAGTIKENRRLVAERSVNGTDYLRTLGRKTELEQQIRAIGAERQALRAEQARLNRIRGTAPFRTELAEIASQLAALGAVVPLPTGAGARYDACVTTRDQSARDRLREQSEVGAIDAKLADLHPDLLVMREAAAITALEADLVHVASARRDYLRVSGQAEASLSAIDDLARRLGVDERGPALRDRLPDIVTRRAAETLLKQHAKNIGASDAAETALQRALQESEDADHALAELPVAADADALREAVEEARNAGPIDAELIKAAALRDTAAGEASRSLTRLALWRGDMATLEATSVPLEADAAELGTELEGAEATGQVADTALQDHDAAIEACRIAMLGIEAAGPLPTNDAIDTLRARRDLAWRLVRRTFVESGAPPTEAEWPGSTPNKTDLPPLFENLLREADALADARHGELARVQDWERQRAEAARLAAQRPNLLAAQNLARRRAGEAEAAWVAAWAPAGIAPQGPAAMREWIRERAAVLAAGASARAAEEAYGRLIERHNKLWARLAAVLSPGDKADLGMLLRDATRKLRALDQEAMQRTTAANRAAKAAKDLSGARRDREALDQRITRWADEWAPVADRLGLPSGADPHVATDLLAIWSELDKELDRSRELQTRLTDMRMAIDQHNDAVAALAKRLDVSVTETIVTDLAERRREADIVEAEQARLQQARAEHEDIMTGYQQTEAKAAAELAVLRLAAGAEDDAGLQATIAAELARADLTRRHQDRAAALRSIADGKTEAELADEAATLDIDAIPGRIGAIEERTAVLDAEASAAAGDLFQVQQDLRGMEIGQDVAGPAQAVQDSLAEIEDAAHRYVRLRLAHALLRGGIDGYRRSQQGPLLAKASFLFGELTGGRYIRLEQDEGEKGEPFIVAVRADRSTCPAGSLSDGTTDQLFLALRLASIALDSSTSEPIPFIADDLLVNFDNARAAAALQLLSDFGKTTQVILFTHHNHLLDLLAPETASVHRLPRELAA